jgi:formylglycine-generating enzyme required for sulfatase activity
MPRRWLLPAALALVAGVDVLSLLPAQTSQKGERYALLVACQDYESKQLRKLACPRRDVQDFAKVLEETGYPEDHIVLMHDGPGQKPALLPEAAKIRRKLATLLETLDEDESVVVAFAGHGVQFVGEDKNYFCPSDADLTDRSTLVDLTEVFDALQRCKAKRKLLLVDACRNDPVLPTTRGGSNVASVSRPPAAVPKGVLALFSCDARQESYEDPELGHGVFFDQVIRSWRGTGGPVTLDEFRRAVRVGTKNRTRTLFDKVQTPVERGEVVLADEWVLNPRQAAARPPLLDCTGPDGVGRDAVRTAQAAWARHLGRKVEETVTVNGVPITFVLIPPGKFLMGSPREEQEYVTRTYYDGKRPDWLDSESPQHEVTISRPFDLAKTELTQAQYRALTGENPSNFKGDDLPVEQVSWTKADDFARQLTKKLADGHLYRLPTEAQWEYSCRGGASASRPYGIGDGTSLSSSQANFHGNSPYGGAAKGEYLQKTVRVGSYAPNAFGLSDMHGNVWEWCSDWYGDYPSGRVTDPTGPASGSRRVDRGGGWGSGARDCRSADRRGDGPGGRIYSLGFRLARVPSGAR